MAPPRNAGNAPKDLQANPLFLIMPQTFPFPQSLFVGRADRKDNGPIGKDAAGLIVFKV
jgi:hypothetical protein